MKKPSHMVNGVRDCRGKCRKGMRRIRNEKKTIYDSTYAVHASVWVNIRGVLAAVGVEVSMYALGKVGDGLLASAKNPI